MDLRNLLAAALPFSALFAAAAHADEFKANHMFVGSVNSHSINEFDESGQFVRTMIPSGMTSPESLAFGPNGRLYAVSSLSNEIFEILPNGDVAKKYPLESPFHPNAISFGPGGFLYVHSTSKRAIFLIDVLAGTGQGFGSIPDASAVGFDDFKFTSNGTIIATVAGQGFILEENLLGQMMRFKGVFNNSLPRGIAVGPFEQVWYASETSSSLVRSTAYLATLDTFGDAAYSQAQKIAFGPNGHLFVCSKGFNNVAEFDARDFSFVRLIGTSAPSMDGVTSIAFAPSRFEGEIDFRLADDENDTDSTEEDVFISIAPGSHSIMVQFKNGKSGDGISSKFFQDAIVFHGTEPMTSGSKRLIDGTEMGNDAGDGTAHIDLEVKASPKGNFGFIVAKKASGHFSRSGAGGFFAGEIKTKKLLNG